jgi:hypothetical protein
LWLPRASLALLALLLLLELILIVPRWQAAALVAAGIWMALPGVALSRAALARGEDAASGAWLIGPGLGFGCSVFGLLLFWAAGVQNWLAILLGPLVTWGIALIVARWGAPVIRAPRLDRRDTVTIAVLLLIVPLITWAPYDHVAEPTADGQAYRQYFTADFVWAMTVTAELAKGDVPPVNPFLRGEPVRYYWMSHLLSGALYRNVRGWGVTAEQVVLVNGLAFGLAFVAFLYWLTRAVGASPLWAALAIAVGFLANSYEGVERLWLLWRSDQSVEMVKTLNIDAVTRWFYHSMPVDGLQRLFLYQPHHLTGYVLSLSALWLAAIADDVTDIRVALWGGVLLALAFLFSTFTAIIVGVAVGVVFAIRLMTSRAYAAVWQCAVLGAAPVAVGIGISSVLGYTDRDDGLLMTFGLNPVATHQWPWVLPLSFGPLLLVGVFGHLRWQWAKRDGLAVTALTVIALLFYFMADVPDMGGVWVGWRSGHLLQITFAMAGAAAFSVLRGLWKGIVVTGAAVAVGLAVPTVAIDVYNAQDITNRGPGPTFPWTVIITPAEREALDWLKRATAPDAVVQIEPVARGPGTWAYIPAFAERRMAGGLPISMIPLQPYQIASETVRLGIYIATNPTDAHAMSRQLGIDYLVFGIEEQHAYAATLTKLTERPDLFRPVFRNDAVTILGVGH